MKKIQT